MKRWQIMREKKVETPAESLQWLTSKRLSMPIMGGDVEKLQLLYIAGEMGK
jgi:hypothetical protein